MSRSNGYSDSPQAILRRYRRGGVAFRKGPALAPHVSINYGAGGIAYAIYRIARARNERRLLDLAHDWIGRSFALASREGAFFNPAIGIDDQSVGRVSLFHSPSGLHLVDALIRRARGGPADGAPAQAAIDAFLQLSRNPCHTLDLTLGTASLLLGCAELVESAPAGAADLASVRARGDEMAGDLVRFLHSDHVATSTDFRYLGIAHGWGGLLFALMRWARATVQPVDAVVVARLDELADLAVPHDGGSCWPIVNVSREIMPGWCHGTAGHALLFALAAESLDSSRYADLAVEAASSAWVIRSPVGSLCCGEAGNGYAFLAVHRLTGDGIWLRRARAAARRATGAPPEVHFPDALYKGAVGVDVLAEDLEHRSTAAMPLFEPTRWVV